MKVQRCEQHNIKLDSEFGKFIDNYCGKCKNHYLLDGDESRCRAISLGISSAMCVQVKECHKFKEK